NGKITEGVFINQTKKGTKWYTHLEWHQWEGTEYVIRNELYESDRPNEIGVRAALGTLYPELEQEVRISNLSRPLFVYFKPNIANNFDTQSPLGISIYAKIGRASCRERGNTSMAAQTRPEPTENTHRW